MEPLGPFNDLSEHYNSHNFFGGKENLIPDPYKINPYLVAKIEEIRAFLGNRKLPVTSGYRTKNHPDEVGKTTPGPHTHGIAGDLDISQYGDPEALYKLLDNQPFMQDVGFGIYPDKKIMHVDVRGKRARWAAYNDTPKHETYATADVVFKAIKLRKNP